MRLGFFGGSFDPIHFGHLLLAEYCCDRAKLDRVLFVPAATSPLKPYGPAASDKQRVEMIKLAIGGNERFELCLDEIQRGDISYTVDTLEAIRNRCSKNELFLIMGADSIADFQEWKQPRRICELALPLVVARRGFDASVEPLRAFMTEQCFAQVCALQVEFPLIEISSTEIRLDVCRGNSIRYRLPRAVEKYIETNRLYVDGEAKC